MSVSCAWLAISLCPIQPHNPPSNTHTRTYNTTHRNNTTHTYTHTRDIRSNLCRRDSIHPSFHTPHSTPLVQLFNSKRAERGEGSTMTRDPTTKHTIHTRYDRNDNTTVIFKSWEEVSCIFWFVSRVPCCCCLFPSSFGDSLTLTSGDQTKSAQRGTKEKKSSRRPDQTHTSNTHQTTRQYNNTRKCNTNVHTTNTTHTDRSATASLVWWCRALYGVRVCWSFSVLWPSPFPCLRRAQPHTPHTTHQPTLTTCNHVLSCV